MKLLAHLNRSVHRLQGGGGIVITVTLLSLAAASILVLAP